MGKWEVNRKIGFIKNFGQPGEERSEQKKDRPLTQKKSVYDWLRERPLINLNGLCKQIGYDRGNLIRNMAAGKELKPELMKKLKEALKPYGYAE